MSNLRIQCLLMRGLSLQLQEALGIAANFSEESLDDVGRAEAQEKLKAYQKAYHELFDFLGLWEEKEEAQKEGQHE